MDMVPVSSSQISEIGYDAETMVAEVRFTNGSLYRYEGVPLGVTDAIIKSDSPGRQFAASLKSGYSYSRVE